MTLLLNGETRDVPHVRTVTDLVAALELPAPAMLVEHNGLALRREEWCTRELRSGDRLEMIRIVAGG